MELAFARTSGSTAIAEGGSPGRGSAIGKGARTLVGVFALALGSAVLLSSTASAAPGCSGPMMVADAIVLPDLSRTG